MTGIETDVLTRFFAQLVADGTVSQAVIDGLREELTAEDLPNPTRLIQLLASGSGEALA